MQAGLGTDGLPEGITQVALSLRYSWFGDHVDGTATVKPVDAPSLESVLAVLGARHYFGKGWAVEVSLPLGNLTFDPGGQVPSERLGGFGDLAVEGSYDLAGLWGATGGYPSVRLRLGLGLPTGSATEFGEDVVGVSPEIVSLGWGAFSLRAGVDIGWVPHRMVALTLPIAAYVPMNRSPEGQLFGAVITYGLGLVLMPGSGWTVGLRVTGEHRQSVDEDGKGEVINSGGELVFAEVAAGLAISDAVHVGITGRLPMFAAVNGLQLVESFSAGAALTLTFGVEEDDEDEDGHDHGDEEGHDHGGAHEGHDHSGADMADVAKGGASFVLADALVAGKVTVIDFWASWCKPCHVITRELRELAAHEPMLAVRRAEAPDLEDTAVAKEHLKGVAGLPVVWVYDPQGQRVATLAPTTPEAVVAAVKDALAKAKAAKP